MAGRTGLIPARVWALFSILVAITGSHKPGRRFYERRLLPQLDGCVRCIQISDFSMERCEIPAAMNSSPYVLLPDQNGVTNGADVRLVFVVVGDDVQIEHPGSFL